MKKRLNLADEIEHFWSKCENSEYSGYKDQLNINHVSLAPSFLARVEPAFFSTTQFE